MMKRVRCENYGLIWMHDQAHLLANLLTMVQNSSKVKPSLVAVFWLTWVLCIISRISSSLRFSNRDLASPLNSQKSTTPFSSLSKRANTFLRPSLVLVSPTLLPMMSMNSSKVMGLFLSLRPWMRLRMKGFLLSTPRSSRALLISAGSMVPLLSSSKISKVFLRSSQSSGWRRSFQAVGAGLETFPELVGAFTLDLLIISERNQQFLISSHPSHPIYQQNLTAASPLYPFLPTVHSSYLIPQTLSPLATLLIFDPPLSTTKKYVLYPIRPHSRAYLNKYHYI